MSDRPFASYISIHSLLAEGDVDSVKRNLVQRISIHSLLAEGDQITLLLPVGINLFQSTPSSQRETGDIIPDIRQREISIHSLLAEGDHEVKFIFIIGRISIHSLLAEGDTSALETCTHSVLFQSTPSSQRETTSAQCFLLIDYDFNPLPPRRGRRILIFDNATVTSISIHSLLAEGDSKNAQKYLLLTYILHTKPTITQANPSLKLIFSNLFSKLTPFSRCESPTHFMCTYHSHLNHIPNFFKPAPSPQLFPLFRYFDPG